MHVTSHSHNSNDNQPPKQILLSRLLITGHIHEQTPVCVLIDIADAHGIKYLGEDTEKPNFSQHILASINETRTFVLQDMKSMDEWSNVARFVNKHSKWPRNKLSQAYNFLIGFSNNENPLPKINHPFLVGPQTPENIFSVNACILYKICVHHRLNVNSHTTINQMAYAVNMLREGTESIMRRVRTFVERDSDRNNLINILMLSHHDVGDPDANPDTGSNNNTVSYDVVPQVEITHETLISVHQSLNDIVKLRHRIEPSTNLGAIGLAALNYSIDISKATNPLREYKLLKASGRVEYKPSDPWMRYWYEYTPIMFDLFVTFNPTFPPQFYLPNILLDMIRNEGYSMSRLENEDPYELLQLAYTSETFYQGKMPRLRSKETVIDLDDVDTVPYGQLLCFGQPESPMAPVTVTELTKLFNSNQNFTNPFRNESIFTVEAINKLKLIAQSPQGPNSNVHLSPETIKLKGELNLAINTVEIMLRNNDEASRNLMLSYRNANSEIKREIEGVLSVLLHMGMHMRGWNGTGAFPVEHAVVHAHQTNSIDENINYSVGEFERRCNKLGEIGRLIKGLPLVLYKDGIYNPSTDSNNGISIADRIEIVMNGDYTSNMASCIRLSSNWVCASAHKYMTCIGMTAPFEIFRLRPIS